MKWKRLLDNRLPLTDASTTVLLTANEEKVRLHPCLVSVTEQKKSAKHEKSFVWVGITASFHFETSLRPAFKNRLFTQIIW